jgi:hypothetical protein
MAGATKPAYRRVIDLHRRPRVSFIPQAAGPYEEARLWAVAHGLTNLLESSDVLLTFFPPASLLTHMEQREYLVRALVLFVRLLPTIKQRVVLARSDPHVTRIGTRTWKELLRGLLFNNDSSDFDVETFWKSGYLSFFGQELNAAIVRGEEPLNIGKLDCGCEATIERFEHDNALIGAVVNCIAQFNRLHELANVLTPHLLHIPEVKEKTSLLPKAQQRPKNSKSSGSKSEKARGKARESSGSGKARESSGSKSEKARGKEREKVVDQWSSGKVVGMSSKDERVYRMPDFFGMESEQPVIKSMLRVVFGTASIKANGWPDWDRENDSLSAQRERVAALQDLFVNWVDASQVSHLVKNDASFSAHEDQLHSLEVFNLQPEELEAWEYHFLKRYFLACFTVGQWPEVLLAPSPPRSLRCADCRRPKKPENFMMSRFDDDVLDEDEPMSEDEKKRQKNIAATKAHRKVLKALRGPKKNKNKRKWQPEPHPLVGHSGQSSSSEWRPGQPSSSTWGPDSRPSEGHWGHPSSSEWQPGQPSSSTWGPESRPSEGHWAQPSSSAWQSEPRPLEVH